MEHSNEMAVENLPPEATGAGIGAILVGTLLVIKKFFGASEEPPERREENRRQNDRFNEYVVKSMSESVDNLAKIVDIHNKHQDEFREDFKKQMDKFEERIDTTIREFKDEVRDDIRELRGKS